MIIIEQNWAKLYPINQTCIITLKLGVQFSFNKSKSIIDYFIHFSLNTTMMGFIFSTKNFNMEWYRLGLSFLFESSAVIARSKVWWAFNMQWCFGLWLSRLTGTNDNFRFLDLFFKFNVSAVPSLGKKAPKLSFCMENVSCDNWW